MRRQRTGNRRKNSALSNAPLVPHRGHNSAQDRRPVSSRIGDVHSRLETALKGYRWQRYRLITSSPQPRVTSLVITKNPAFSAADRTEVIAATTSVRCADWRISRSATAQRKSRHAGEGVAGFNAQGFPGSSRHDAAAMRTQSRRSFVCLAATLRLSPPWFVQQFQFISTFISSQRRSRWIDAQSLTTASVSPAALHSADGLIMARHPAGCLASDDEHIIRTHLNTLFSEVQ